MSARRIRARKGGASKPKQGSSYEKFVADVVSALEPGADVKYSQWVLGPDGRRDMDVVVRGTVNGTTRTLLIECKDYDVRRTGKVDIHFIDALESKRRDLDVDVAILCSNSGFTEGAVNKARRVNIALVSALKRGDDRVKFKLDTELYSKRARETYYRVISCQFSELPLPDDAQDFVSNATYEGKRVLGWVLNRITDIIQFHSEKYNGEPARLACRFIHPIDVEYAGRNYPLEALEVEYHADMEWLCYPVTMDAHVGIYDHLRGRISTPHGAGIYIDGLEEELGRVVDSPPAALMAEDADPLFGSFVDFSVWFSKRVIDEANLDPVIVEEDQHLRLNLVGSAATP